MRLFFGLALPASLATAIDDWRTRQFPLLERGVPNGNFHITLAFLGECGPGKLERLTTATDALCATDSGAYGAVELSETGYWAAPQILWLGPTACPPPLAGLANRLATLGSTCGARRDKRPYQPHLTLARRCEQPPPAPLEKPQFRFEYDHFTLFQSHNGRRGVSYQAIADWPLP